MKIILEIYQKVKSVKKIELLFLLLFLSAVAATYSFISVNIHNHFMTFGLDLGYFDETIWKISRGVFPYSGVGCIWLLEDHFQPILYLLAPLYWLWNDVRVLLVFQAIVMVFAALPLYLLSKKITQSINFSFGIVFSYLFFMGTQFAILNEFHQVTIAPLFLGLIFYALSDKKLKLYWLGILGLLFTKEDLTLLIAAIGIGLMIKKETRKLGLTTMIIGIAAFIFLVYWLLPAISIKGVYSHMDFGSAGYTPIDVVKKSISDPLFFIKSMVYPMIKLRTIFQSLFTFGFLPIFAPAVYLLPLFEDFVSRFIYSGPQFTKWGLVNHHAATSAMLLAISSVYGAWRLVSLIKLQKDRTKTFTIVGLIIIFSTISADVIFHGPVNSLFKKQFYEDEQWMKDDREVLSEVPQNASVGTQNNLAPHLTHRDNIYRLPYGLNSEYMVVDLHDGPNKYAPLSFSEMKDFVGNLLTTKRYSVIYQKGDAMLLKRNYKTDITKSKYYGDTRYCYYSYEER